MAKTTNATNQFRVNIAINNQQVHHLYAISVRSVVQQRTLRKNFPRVHVKRFSLKSPSNVKFVYES